MSSSATSNLLVLCFAILSMHVEGRAVIRSRQKKVTVDADGEVLLDGPKMAEDISVDDGTEIKAHSALIRAEVDSTGESHSKSICGDGEEIDDTSCLAEDSLQKSHAQATVYFLQKGCTGWLVKAPTASTGGLILSTGHCGTNEVETMVFNYVRGPCSGTHRRRSQPSTDRCNATRRSWEAARDEQVIYELDNPCSFADEATPILLDVARPDVGEQVYIIGHPNRRPQKISYEEQHDEGNHCVLRGFFAAGWLGGSQRAQYYCDTQGGNSGSPVFSARTGRAFAIHSHGGCSRVNEESGNSGGLLEEVVEHLDEFDIPYVNRSDKTLFAHQVSSRQSSLCLNYDTITSNINLLICAGDNSQKWYFDVELLKNLQDSTKCLAYNVASDNVHVASCDASSDSHKWFFNGKQFKSKESDAKCLGKASDSNNVIMSQCDNGAGQMWYFKRQDQTSVCDRDIDLGRGFRISRFTMNGQCASEVTVLSGSHVTVALDYFDFEGHCTGCIEQIYVGIQGQPLNCIYNGNARAHRHDDYDLNLAGLQPGEYTIVGTSTWQYNCVERTDGTELAKIHVVDSFSSTAACERDVNLGRGFSITRFTVNGQCVNEITVIQGSSLKVALDYYDYEGHCTGCIEQIYVGVRGQPLNCIYNGNAWQHRHDDYELNLADLQPGEYTIVGTSTWQYHCVERTDGTELVKLRVVHSFGTWTSHGSCTHEGPCLTSSNYPSNYGNNENCTASIAGNQSKYSIHVDDFNTEGNFDYLYVGGVSYSGTNQVGDLDPAEISWSSDYSVTRKGWKLCLTDA